MYYHQKGLEPIIRQVLGLIISGVFFIYSIKTFVPNYVNFIWTLPAYDAIIITIKLLAGLSLYLIIPFYFGILLTSKYPSVKITGSGIKYLFFFGICKGVIKWNEIEEIRTQINGDVILLINRKGISIFNGLYFFSMHGDKYYEPILILSRSTENFEVLLSTIESKVASHYRPSPTAKS